MGRGLVIAFLLACAAVPARAGLGVFANGVELSKDASWEGSPFVRYNSGMDAFLVRHPFDLPSDVVLSDLTISGTNLNGEVRLYIHHNSSVTFENLCLRTTATNRPPVEIKEEAILFLSGVNRLEGAPRAPGLQLAAECSLVITNAPNDERGTLVAVGGDDAAGIGSGYLNGMAESLTIGGGMIEAYGKGENASGIGQGLDDGINLVAMTGGTVLARGDGGPDISTAGYGMIPFTGGSLDIRTWTGWGPMWGTDYRRLRPVSIRNADWAPGDRIAIDFIQPELEYGTNSLFVGSDNGIHLWLPCETNILSAGGFAVRIEELLGPMSFDFSGNTFAEWCMLRGLEPREDAVTDGEPNILRYLFNKPHGPVPMPELDPAPKYPSVVIPPTEREYPDCEIWVVGTTDLSVPVNRWEPFVHGGQDPEILEWPYQANPRSLFIRYHIEYPPWN